MKRGPVLIVGAAGWRNVGDDLIADRLVRRATEDGNSAVLAGGPAPLEWLPAGVHQIPLSGSNMDRLRLLRAIARSREVWIGGGGLFDDRHPEFYRPFDRMARAAHLLRTPYRIVSVGVGPIQRKGTAAGYRWVFEHAASATVRDEASRERVQLTGARRLPQVEPDPALWEAPASAVAAPRHDLLVNLRNWEHGHLAEHPAETPTGEVVEAVAAALNRVYPPTASIGLVSMSARRTDDDAVPLEALADKLDARVSRYYGGDVAEVEALTARAGGVLSMRLHLCLLGALHKVPTAGLAYDPKVTQQGGLHGFPTAPLVEGFSVESVVQLLAELDGLRR